MEAIVQNTAQVASENNAFRSNIELQQNRYKILGSARDQRVRDGIYLNQTSKQKYSKDPEAYYPYLDPTKDRTPVVEQNRIDNPLLYDKDKKAYYNPTGEFKIIPTPYIGKTVPVNLGELQNSFPTEKNLQGLRNQLKAISMRENLDINAIVQKGIYYPDPNAYYDPSLEDTSKTIKDLQGKVASMEHDLNDNLRNNLNVEIGTVAYHQQVQNSINKENEIKASLEKQNYYTPVVNENGRSLELPVGTPVKSTPKKEDKVVGPKEDVDIVEHNYVEAEEIINENKNNDNNNNSNPDKQDRLNTVNKSTNANLRKLKEEKGRILSTNKVEETKDSKSSVSEKATGSLSEEKIKMIENIKKTA